MTVEKGYVKKAYLGEQFAYRAYYNGQIIWDYTVDAIGTLASKLNAMARPIIETPTSIILYGDSSVIGAGMATTIEITPVFGYTDADITIIAKSRTAETVRTIGQMISNFQAIGGATTYGVVYTRGNLEAYFHANAMPDTLELAYTYCDTSVSMSGFALASDCFVRDISLVADVDICGISTPKTQDVEKSLMCIESKLNSNAFIDTVPVHTVTFMHDGRELYKTKVIHGYNCPDPVDTGKIGTPTKEMTPQYTYKYSGWTRTEGGESDGDGDGGGGAILMEQQRVDGFSYEDMFGVHMRTFFTPPFALTVGKTYTVVWDGVEYVCVAQDVSAIMSGWTAIGNIEPFGLDGNGEPFIIAYCEDEMNFFAFDDVAAYSVGVYEGEVRKGALENITEDTIVYPAFEASIRYYTVRFFDGDTVVDRVSVPYGGTATTDYMKEGCNHVTWVPSNENITGETVCYGQFGTLTFADATWAQIAEISESGQASNYFSCGDTKIIDYNGTACSVEIICFNHDVLADGSGKAGITCMTSTAYNTNIKSTPNLLYSSAGLHSQLNTTVLNYLSDDLKSVIKPVLKKCDGTTKNGYNGATVDVEAKLWALSTREMGDATSYSSTETFLGAKYEHTISPTELLTDNNYMFETRTLYRYGKVIPYYYLRTGGIVRKNYDYTERSKYTAKIVFGFCV